MAKKNRGDDDRQSPAMLGGFGGGFLGYFLAMFGVPEPHTVHWLAIIPGALAGYGGGWFWPDLARWRRSRTEAASRR